jgi:hypothetical protein
MQQHSVNNFSSGRPPLTPVVTASSSAQHRGSISHSTMMSPTQGQASTTHYHPPQLPPSYNFSSPTQMYSSAGNSQGPVLPPFSSLQQGNTHQGNMSSVRYNSHGDSTLSSSASGSKRTAPPSSNVTSVNSSDNEEDDNGGLPASGLVAPWEVLRNLANVAIQREAKVYYSFFSIADISSDTTPCRRMGTAASHRVEQGRHRPKDSRGRQSAGRSGIRFVVVYTRMVSLCLQQVPIFSLHDIVVVTKEIISEKEARELFRMCVNSRPTFTHLLIGLAVSFTVAPPFYPYLMQIRTLMRRCMIVLLSP